MSQSDILHSQTQTQPAGRAKSSLSGQQAAREILLLCTTANISPEKKERICQILSGTVDWRYLLELAELHSVAPLIAHNLVTNDLVSQAPQHHLERLKQIYNNALFGNVILLNELTKVLFIFNQNGIAAVVLKGCVLAEQLYGNPGLRTVGDMDILVHPEALSLAGSLLLEMGYQQWDSEHAWNHPFHEIPYYKKAQFPFLIELHWSLDDQRLVAVPQQEIWHRAQLLHTQGDSTRVLSPEDNLLFLSNQPTKEPAQLLRYLSDIAELLKKYDGVLDWNYIIESAHSWGIGAAVYYSLRWSRELLGAVVPVSVVRALKPEAWRRWLLDFLISQAFFISTPRLSRLRDETYNIARSLMMKHFYQTVLVLIRHRESVKRGAWLRTAIWIILVFSAALGRNMAGVVSRKKWGDTKPVR